MKALLVSALLLLCALAQALPIDYAAPEFLQPMYDAYTTNYINATATGRGYTGASDMGGLENAFLNPAAFHVESASMFAEFLIKTHTDAIATADDNNISGTQTYINPLPFDCLAIGFAPFRNSSVAIAYTRPQSIRYDRYAMRLTTGDTIDRYPELVNNRLSLSANTAFNHLTVGFTVTGDFIYQDDYRNYYQLDRIETSDFLLRVQPGLHYQAGNWGFGLTDLLPVSHDFDMDYNETYDVTFANILTGGVSYRFGDLKLLGEARYEQWSAMSDSFDDRLRLSLGGEMVKGSDTWRLGLMSVPSVYDGEFYLPNELTESGRNSGDGGGGYDQGSEYYPESNIGVLKETDQLFVTGGWTRHFKGGQWSLAVAVDTMGYVPVVQLQAGLTITFNRIGQWLKSKPKTDDDYEG
jgi:hypothetical protein